MTTKVRRAGKRWREAAPDYVVDCFDHPKFGDRFSVIVINDDDTVSVLSSSESLTISGWRDITKHDAAAWRYRSSRNRIKWMDLPERIRMAVIHDMNPDNYQTTITEGDK